MTSTDPLRVNGKRLKFQERKSLSGAARTHKGGTLPAPQRQQQHQGRRQRPDRRADNVAASQGDKEQRGSEKKPIAGLHAAEKAAEGCREIHGQQDDVTSSASMADLGVQMVALASARALSPASQSAREAICRELQELVRFVFLLLGFGPVRHNEPLIVRGFPLCVNRLCSSASTFPRRQRKRTGQAQTVLGKTAAISTCPSWSPVSQRPRRAEKSPKFAPARPSLHGAMGDKCRGGAPVCQDVDARPEVPDANP